MKIKVTGALVFRQLLGGGEAVTIEIEQGTLRDVLGLLGRRFGSRFEALVFERPDGNVKQTNLITLNGEPYWNLQKKLDSELMDGDEIRLSPIVTGG